MLTWSYMGEADSLLGVGTTDADARAAWMRCSPGSTTARTWSTRSP
ncbi:MAG: hypothetical protein U0P45_06995 [Acidimicrobiales bacterium]